MKLSSYLFAITIFVVGIFVATPLKAAHEKYTDYIKDDLAGKQITVTDQRYSEMNAGNFRFFNEKVDGRIVLSVDADNKSYQPTNYTASVQVTGSYYIYNGTAFVSKSISATLEINYSASGVAYTNKNVLNLPGAHMITLSVASSTITPAGSKANLKLTAEIEINRYYDLNLSLAPTNLVCYNRLTETGEIEFIWNPVTNAEEYDLEWVFVNDYGKDGNSITPEQLEVENNLFRNNSTRITTSVNRYKIPYIYDKGYILYRVRAVGRSALNNYAGRMEGAWSFDPLVANCSKVSCFPDKFYSGTYAHQANLNWQFTASYAEEGKSKVVLNYFDGIFRDRQSVTRINSLDKSLVGEKIYDYQSRPAIQVLPVPVNDNRLDYRPLFNLNTEGSAPYSSDQFDVNKSGGGLCYPSPMSNVSGASNYYSPKNSNKTGHNAYIPDAQGFPFIQTEYTPDNTGRVKAVSMPGPVHQLQDKITSPEYVTRNYYGTPNKEDMDALFGSEAGDASHYKKNMVRDPNGQMSITYIDPAGRTIATSLTATSPDNLIALNPSAAQITTVDLLNKQTPSENKGSSNALSLEDMTLVVDRKIIIPAEQKPSFAYEMQGQTYTNNCSNTITLPDKSVITKTDQRCYNCVYDLAFSLVDELGNEFISDVKNKINDPTVVGQSILTAIDNKQSVECSSQPLPTINKADIKVPTNLKPGNYSLRKVLKVNQKALDYYTDQYFSNNNCLLDLNYFLNNEYLNIDFSGCLTCEECKNLTGDFKNYDITQNPDCEPCLTEAQYKKVIAQCEGLCESGKSTKCLGAYNAMLSDMVPGGQYGEYQESGKMVDDVLTQGDNEECAPEKFPLSVFNENNLLPRKSITWRPNWRNPFGGSYKEDDDVTESMIQLVKISETEFEPKVLDVKKVNGDNMTVPTNLADVKDFILNWKPSWAKSLVNYHPEYPLYELCGQFQASHDFDYEWLNNHYELVTEIPSAWKETGAAFKFEDFDPFFKTLPSELQTIFIKMMRKTLNNYTVSKDGSNKILSIWQVMWQTAHSTSDICSQDQAPSDPKITTKNEWDIFKSLYNSAKMKFEQKYITYYSINGGFYNGCIGDKTFTPAKDRFIYSKISTSTISWLPKLFRGINSQFFNYIQPCNYARYAYYKEKDPRFQAYKDLLQFEFLKNNECDGNLDTDGVTPDGVSIEEPLCVDAMKAALAETKNTSDLAIYKMCGQCPVARDIQELLKALQTDNKLLTTTRLSCNYKEFTDGLRVAIGATLGENVDWTKVSHVYGSTFEAKLGKTAFIFKLPTNSLYDFSEITKLCCFSYQPNPILLSQLENGNFTINATVKIKPSDPEYNAEFPLNTKDITIEGYCGLDLKNCSFTPVCTPTLEAIEVMGLLNALTLNETGLSTPVLTSSTPVRLTIDENGSPATSILYSAALTDNLRSILDDNIGASIKNTNWHWVATSITSGNLTALIQDGTTPTGGQCEVMLYGMPNGFTYNDIVSFSNIKPDPADEYDFTITALLQTSTARQYVTLKGNIAYFPIGTCETTVPNEWDPTGGISSKANTGYYFCKESETAKNILNFMNEKGRNWSQFKDKEYVILTIPSVNTKVELWMPPMSDNFFSDVVSFSDIKPDQKKLGNNVSTKYFEVTATKANGTKVLVNGYCFDLWMGNCFPTINADCPTNNAVNIVLDELNLKAKAGLVTSNLLKINYIDVAIDVNLNFVSTGLSHSNIQSFSHIIPKTDVLNADGTSNQFYVIAHMKNGEINQMEGTVPNIVTSNCKKAVGSSGPVTELVRNGSFDNVISNANYPEKICTSPNSACSPGSQLMSELQFETDLNYKYTWGHQSGTTNNFATFRIASKIAGYLPSYSGSGLFVDGNITKAGKDYTIVWLQEIDVLPGKDYNFSCLFSNLQGHGAAQLDVVLFDDSRTNFTSLLRDGASVQVGDAKPVILTSSTGGITVNLATVGNNRVWYKVKRRFNSSNSSKITLAIIDYSFKGSGNDFIIDDISLKEPGVVNYEAAGYSEDKNFLCNVPDFKGSVTPPDQLLIKETPCVGHLKDIAKHNAQINYDIYKAEQRVNFREEYIKKCLDVYEKLLMTSTDGENHYTLYYYDQAGNLVRTVPPEGVKKVPADKLAQVATDRINNEQTVFTDHELVSTYKYNSLNQLVAQSAPDLHDLNMKEMGQSNVGIPSGYDIKGITFSDAFNGYAIANDGTNGHFYKTADAGKTWTEITGMGVGDILDVKHFPGNVVFAVGERGLIMKSTDGGNSWQQKTINSQGALAAIYFSSTSNGLIVEKNGRIWASSDAGETWQGPSDRLLRVINGLVTDVAFTSASNGFVTTNNGKIYATTDGAVTWNEQNIIRAGNLTNVSYYNGVAYAAGDNGTILKRVLGGNWEKLATLRVGDIRKIHVSSASQICIITNDDKLWYSNDFGQNWQIIQTNVESFIFTNPQTGYAFSSGAVLQTTTDGGATWSGIGASFPVTEITGFYINGTSVYIKGSDKSLYRVAADGITWEQVNTIDINGAIKKLYISEPYAYALTNDGTLWVTQNIADSYTIWAKAVTGTEANKDFVDMDWANGQNGMLVKPTGKILSTSDGCSTFALTELKGITGNLQGITLETKDIATVVGLDGESWTTTNAGVNWVNESGKVLISSVNSIKCTDNNQCFATGNNGSLLKTINGGNVWSLQNSGTSQNLNGLSLYSNTKGFAVGDQGTILELNSTWAVVSGASTKSLFDVVNTSGSEGIAIGAGTTIVGGNGWVAKNIPASLENLKSISINPSDQDQLVAVGQKGKLYKSSDGGSNWAMVNSLAPAILNATQMVTSVSGYAVGNSGQVYRTSDAGSTWRRVAAAGNVNLTGLYFPDPIHGIVIGNNGTAYTTSNGGESWTLVSMPVTVNLNSVAFAHSTLGFIAADNGVLLTSQNGLAGPWVQVTLTITPALTGNFTKVNFINSNLGFVVGASGVILRTTNQGSTWALLNQSLTTDELTDVYFTDTKIGYVVSKQGVLLKTVNGGDTWEDQNAPAGGKFNTLAAADGNSLFIAGPNGSVLKVVDFTDMYSSQFYYDRLGRLVASQNAKQYNSNHNKYSYTIYDEQNRITEVGEIIANRPVAELYDGGLLDNNSFLQWIALGTRTEVTHTYYDVPINAAIDALFGTQGQQNLRSRVASITYEDTYDNDANTFSNASHYSYDVHGNVKKLVQDNPGLATYNNQYVVIEYEYDLISNKVNLVKYQDGKPDQFFHKYEYDSDNRITSVYTSRDNAIWDEDAAYTYYDHGPLARVELGDAKVQGVDYAYTIQGWLKGINSNTLNPNRDIGKDGATTTGNINANIPKDLFGYTLGYYSGDYKAINSAGASHFEATTTGAGFVADPKYNLYNGNIGHTTSAIGEFMKGAGASPQVMAYQYDQLNRLKQASEFTDATVVANNTWTPAVASTGNYSMSLEYDANGNIKTLQRKANGGVLIDNLQYKYENVANGYLKNTNKLRAVIDNATPGANYDDIQPGQTWDAATEAGNNYGYDEVGNMIRDKQEEIAYIEWTLSGKIRRITRTAASNKPDLEYGYDVVGNRIMKIVKPRSGGVVLPQSKWTYTYYTRDAQGNVMATYQRPENSTDLFVNDFSLYGSSRLGTLALNQPLSGLAATSQYSLKTGKKAYELTNHLGNVMATFTDVRKPRDTNADGITDTYEASLVSANDYYPFGMLQPGRKFNSPDYKYGFNGKEKDDDINGTGVTYDYGFRIYDARVARFLSVDPLTKDYPWYTPYQFAGNSPIFFIDLDGLEPNKPKNPNDKIGGQGVLANLTQQDVYNIVYKAYTVLMQKNYIVEDGKGGHKFDGKRFAREHAGNLKPGDRGSKQYDDYVNAYQTASNNANEIINSEQYDVFFHKSPPKYGHTVYEIAKQSENVLRTYANFIELGGNIIEGAGYIALLVPGGQGIGAVLIITGRTVDMLGAGLDIAVDVYEGKTENALKKAAIEGVGLIGSAGAEKLLKVTEKSNKAKDAAKSIGILTTNEVVTGAAKNAVDNDKKGK